MINKGKITARKVLKECGIIDPTKYPIDLLINGRGGYVTYKDIPKADGRIVFSKNKTPYITVNSNIEYEGKKRFVTAHEWGHMEMHSNLQMHNDNDSTLNWFGDSEKYKSGIQEWEANEFASEVLMPEQLFKEECEDYYFSPALLRQLAERFGTSITSTAYRFLEYGNHPICLVASYNGKVQYYKKSKDFYPKLIVTSKDLVPSGSVANEYVQKKYGYIYSKKESKQEILKSDWFELTKYDKGDSTYYEYCIVVEKYKSILSIIWED